MHDELVPSPLQETNKCSSSRFINQDGFLLELGTRTTCTQTGEDSVVDYLLSNYLLSNFMLISARPLNNKITEHRMTAIIARP